MVIKMGFEDELTSCVSEVESIIKRYLPKSEGYQKTVIEAMNYSFSAGGKRLRPLIMYKTYRAMGGNDESVYPFMAALEMIHTYSLVHDDLPEMDNDELRRGKPTAHVVYGQAMAVLAGDGLLNYAFETVTANAQNCDAEKCKRILSAINILGKKAGIYGMIGGQTVDVEAEKKNLKLTKEQILFTYENKTSALLQAAFMIGAVLAGADSKTVEMFENAGYLLGIAFQLQDDILDIVGDTKVLGKPVGSDDKNGKVTYVSYLGMERAVSEQKILSEETIKILDSVQAVNKEEVEFLIELVKSLVTRKL